MFPSLRCRIPMPRVTSHQTMKRLPHRRRLMMRWRLTRTLTNTTMKCRRCELRSNLVLDRLSSTLTCRKLHSSDLITSESQSLTSPHLLTNLKKTLLLSPLEVINQARIKRVLPPLRPLPWKTCLLGWSWSTKRRRRTPTL
jgi:hypothetical protein